MLHRGRDGCHVVIGEGLPICFQSFDKVSVGRGRGRVKRRGEENKREEKRREGKGREGRGGREERYSLDREHAEISKLIPFTAL